MELEAVSAARGRARRPLGPGRHARAGRAGLELADEVDRFDDEVDDAYFAIQEGIESLLARQTPVASDLRLVLAMLHVNLHLERMADYCVTVAKLTKLSGGTPSDAADRRRAWPRWASRAEEMTRVALRSFQRPRPGAGGGARRPRRADRPHQPPPRRATCSSWTPVHREWGCGCSSSRAASSGSATTRSTSASRPPTSSPASSASSRTPRIRKRSARPSQPSPTDRLSLTHPAGRSPRRRRRRSSRRTSWRFTRTGTSSPRSGSPSTTRPSTATRRSTRTSRRRPRTQRRSSAPRTASSGRTASSRSSTSTRRVTRTRPASRTTAAAAGPRSSSSPRTTRRRAPAS